MNEFDLKQLSDWLDGVAPESVESSKAFGQESHSEVAASLLIHGLLSDLSCRDSQHEAARIQQVMELIDAEQLPAERSISPRSRQHTTRRRFALLTSAVAIAATLIAMISILGPQPSLSAAMASLEKVLEAATKPFDRTYEMHVVEEYPRDKRPRNLPQEMRERKLEEEIDGTELYVRGADKFVFARMLKAGGQRISGCDGVQSWAFRENGPVHVSSDPSRFRGGIPGEQQDMPFINIHSHLEQLRTGYHVELDQRGGVASDGTQLSRLVGTRKSQNVRGPKLIEIWFDADSGTIHQLLLDGLPRGGGGPKSVSLELVSQRDLGPSFFAHESHHEPDRRVRYEEAQP